MKLLIKQNSSIKAINFGRIGGPATQAVDALHAVLVLVEREDITEGNIAIGSGSIVTRNKVLTCAHVVRAATGVSVGFYNARFESIRFRLSKAEYWLPLQGFNSQTFENDLAVLFFPTNSFPAANVIPVAITQPETGSAAFLASYGFTSPESKAPTQFPLLAAHTVATCTDIIKATPSHFCAGATAPAVVCPGDNGGGLYFGDGPARRLVSFTFAYKDS